MPTTEKTPPVVEVGHPSADVVNGGKLVGQPVRRVEDARLLAGLGRYVDDRPVLNPLHVAIRRSDQAHARIRGIDLRAARALRGVAGVFTAADLEGLVKPAIATSRMADYQATPIYALANGKVHYVGEPVVAVVAESRYVAEDALELIEIDYEVLPVATDPEQAAAPDAPLLHDGLVSNVLVQRAFVRGEVDAAFDAAPLRVGGRFRFHRKTSVAMENRCYLAEVDSGRDALTLYTSSQVPGIIRDALAELLDLPGNRLTVIAPDVGGGFGGKTSLYQEEMLVCALARKLGKAVKWTGDRLEDLVSTSQAFDERVDAELAVDTEGHILGLRADVLGDVGAYSIYPWTAGIEPVQVVSFLPGPYRVPCYRGKVRGVTTPKSPTGPYRGVGRPTSTFVMERLMDMAAARVGIDPVEMRRRNLVRPEEFPYKTPSGIVWDRSAFIEGLEAACERLDYAQARESQRLARAQGRWVGIGVACYAELSGIGSRISASPGMPINTGTDTCVMRLDSTGSITASFGCASHGQGHETTLAQVVADELGARLADIRIVTGDSAAVPHGTGSYASRTAVISSGAGMLAARELRQRMLRLAAFLLDAQPDAIEIVQSEFRLPLSGKRLAYADLARALYSQMGRVPHDMREELVVTKVYDPVVGTASSSTHIVELEIDPQTYAVHLRRHVIAEDCGKIINPMIVDGQTRGAVAQGVGAALLEEVVYDAEGQLLTASLVDYLVPSAPEVLDVEIVHLQTEAPNTLGGFRGMGEGGTIGAPAAIANAVADALSPLGIDIHELPVTPERLFRLIHASRNRSTQESNE
ncbi:MAG: xanthine dehydrogenase family protein [Burkholderiales bacterium]|nr:xanthine dehydrogenase family protein [Burkholderiales bacterium]